MRGACAVHLHQSRKRGSREKKRGELYMRHFRFVNPLMQPHVVMRGVASGMIVLDQLKHVPAHYSNKSPITRAGNLRGSCGRHEASKSTSYASIDLSDVLPCQRDAMNAGLETRPRPSLRHWRSRPRPPEVSQFHRVKAGRQGPDHAADPAGGSWPDDARAGPWYASDDGSVKALITDAGRRGSTGMGLHQVHNGQLLQGQCSGLRRRLLQHYVRHGQFLLRSAGDRRPKNGKSGPNSRRCFRYVIRTCPS